MISRLCQSAHTVGLMKNSFRRRDFGLRLITISEKSFGMAVLGKDWYLSSHDAHDNDKYFYNQQISFQLDPVPTGFAMGKQVQCSLLLPAHCRLICIAGLLTQEGVNK